MKKMTFSMLIAILILGGLIYGTCTYLSSEPFRKKIAATESAKTQSRDSANSPANLINAPVVKADLFKNGLAILTREVNIDANTSEIDLDIDPVIIHGSLSITPRECKLVRTTREVPVEPKSNVASTWFELFANQNVTVELTNGKQVSGLVVVPEQTATNPEEKENNLAEIVVRSSSYYAASPVSSYSPAAGKLSYSFLTIKREDGTYFTVNADKIASVESQVSGNATDSAAIKKTLKYKNVYRLIPPEGYTGKVSISYLTKGLFWTPSYKFTMLNDNQLRIETDFEICNSLEDMNQVDFRCISGYPNLEMGNIFSPLTQYQTPLSFLQRLTSYRSSYSVDSSGIMGQASILSNRAIDAGGASGWDFSTSGGDTAETDMEYMPVGKLTLQKDGVIHIPFKTATTKYESLITIGSENSGKSSASQVKLGKQICFDAIHFTNPMDVAITTAPCLFFMDGKLLGQTIGGWIPSGKAVTLPITKTLNIFAELSDTDNIPDNDSNAVSRYDSYKPYLRTKKLSIRNGRPSKVHLTVAINVLGKFMKLGPDTPQPTITPLPVNLSSYNQTNEFAWDLELEPGAAKDLVFTVREYINR